MEIENVLNTLYEVIPTHFPKLFKQLVVNWVNNDVCISEWPPIIIFSPLVQAINVLVDLKIAKQFNQDINIIRKKSKHEEDFMVGQVKTTMLYNINKYYLEYFICERKSIDKVVLCKFLKTHISTKPLPHQNKHIVKLFLYEKVSKAMCTTIQNVLDKYSHSTIFIIICSNASFLDLSLKNRCLALDGRFTDIGLSYFPNDVQSLLRQVVHFDITQVSFYSVLVNFLKTNIHKMKCTTDNRCMVIADNVHEFSLKLMNTFISAPDICKACFFFVQQNYPDKVLQVLDLCAHFEHSALHVNKQSFTYESLFFKIIDLVTNQNHLKN